MYLLTVKTDFYEMHHTFHNGPWDPIPLKNSIMVFSESSSDKFSLLTQDILISVFL